MFETLKDKVSASLSLGSGMHIEEDRELMIENCTRIEEYDEMFMQLISGRLRVQVWGSSLRASDYKPRGVVIRGKISRIELAERSVPANERPAKGQH